jgi:hypothetical protein
VFGFNDSNICHCDLGVATCYLFRVMDIMRVARDNDYRRALRFLRRIHNAPDQRFALELNKLFWLPKRDDSPAVRTTAAVILSHAERSPRIPRSYRRI